MFLLFCLRAAADLAPPPDLMKPCTIAAQCDETEEGQTCTESAQDAFACASLTEQGYARRCNGETDAEGAWEVVFCRTRTEHAPVDVPAEPAPTDLPGAVVPPSQRRCATASGGGGIALTLALLLVARRRTDV